MAINKLTDFFNLTPKLSIVIVASSLLITLIFPGSVLSKSELQNSIGSKFGNYLAGRQAQFDSNSRVAIRYYLSALEKAPNNMFLLRRVITLLVSEGRIEEALHKTNRLLKSSIDRSNISRLILVLYNIKNQKFTLAFDDLNKFPKGGLNDYLLPMLKAWSLAGEKKHVAALRIIDQESFNQGLEALYGLQGALISEFTKNNKDAINRHISSMELRKSMNFRATILLGNLYERLNKTQKAKTLYDEYKRLRPETTILDTTYSRLKLGKKPDQAVKTIADGVAEALLSLSSAIQNQSPFQAIIYSRLAIFMRPSFTTAKLLLAEILEDNENLKEANDIFHNISNGSRYSWVARLRIAKNLDRLGETDKAIRELQIMSMEKKRRIDALVEMGNILQRHKRYQASINAYEQAKKRLKNINGQSWSLYFSLGISYERIGKWPLAEKNLLQALKLRPNHPSLLNYLGYSWVEQGLQLDRAQEMIQRAVKQRPRDGYIIDSLGWALYRLGKIKEAAKQLERAVLLRPEDPTINDHLGDIYWLLGRKNEAKFQWNRALILEPEKDQIPLIKKKIKVGLPKDKNKQRGI